MALTAALLHPSTAVPGKLDGRLGGDHDGGRSPGSASAAVSIVAATYSGRALCAHSCSRHLLPTESVISVPTAITTIIT
jgi:hypothetical protein